MAARPVAWLAATFASNALVQVAVTLAWPVSTYRLLALTQTITMVWVVALVPDSRGDRSRPPVGRQPARPAPGLAGLLVGPSGIAPVFYLLGAVLVGSAAVVARYG